MLRATIDDRLEVKVVVERGSIDRLDHILAEAQPYKVMVITDEPTRKHWIDRVARGLRSISENVDVLAVPAGESCKSVEVAVKVWRRMLKRGFTRDSMVVGVGGGAVLDLAGFTASTYMRGCKLAYIPTTLLAQADACLGGKTGVNLEGKNIVGTFYHPHYVVVDPQTLDTLPEETYRSGIAEIVKHSVIEGRGAFDRLRCKAHKLLSRDPETVEEAVRMSLAVKLNVVARDYRERGFRMILNFGHTLGHALERALGYRLTHGEAVSIGMTLEGMIAVELTGFPQDEMEELEATLKLMKLPTKPPIHPKALIGHVRVDKKLSRGRPVLALPERIGAVKIVDVDWEVLEGCVSTLKT